MNKHTYLNDTISIIGNKWRLQILYQLRNSRLRFSQLKQAIPLITHKTLIHELRNLMLAGLVEREMYAQIPPRVEYYITPLGYTTIPIIDSMISWGNYYSTCHPTHSNYTPLPVELTGYSLHAFPLVANKR